jgi:hypothetical protein
LAEVRGAQRVGVLAEHTDRDGIAPMILGQQKYFEQLARLANSVPVYLVSRPGDGWSLDDVVDEIEALGSAEETRSLSD